MKKTACLMVIIKTIRATLKTLHFTPRVTQWIAGSCLLFCMMISIHPVAFANSTIVIYGDSLSAGYGIDIKQGWVSLLQNRLLETGYNYQVINASISGETTAGGRHRINDSLKKYRPEIIVIELGGNDGLRGMSLTEMKDNLATIILASIDYQAKVLLMSIEIPPNYGPRYNQQFRQTYTTLAKEYTVNLVPFLLKSVATNPAYMQADGIHPKANAQGMILDNIWPFLTPLLQQPSSEGKTPE